MYYTGMQCKLTIDFRRNLRLIKKEDREHETKDSEPTKKGFRKVLGPQEFPEMRSNIREGWNGFRQHDREKTGVLWPCKKNGEQSPHHSRAVEVTTSETAPELEEDEYYNNILKLYYKIIMYYYVLYYVLYYKNIIIIF